MTPTNRDELIEMMAGTELPGLGHLYRSQAETILSAIEAAACVVVPVKTTKDILARWLWEIETGMEAHWQYCTDEEKKKQLSWADQILDEAASPFVP